MGVDDKIDDPIAEAQGLAKAIEAENTERINKLLAAGANPLSIQISAIQIRLEELISMVPMPPLLRAQFEVAYEAALTAFLDEAQSQVIRQQITAP